MTTVMSHDPLNEFLCVISAQLADGARPQRVNTPLGEVELSYDVDDNDEPYVFVPYPGQGLPLTGWLTEIDDKTYGRLFGFRRYLEESGGVAG
jgi:hypothetical protein